METQLHSFKYSIGYLLDQVADITEERMVAQHAGIANHAAWTLGHVAYACDLLGTVIGLPRMLPAERDAMFGTGSKPVSDRSVYPSKDKLTTELNAVAARLASRVEEIDDAVLDSPFPDPSLLDVFPTIRHGLTQVMIGHTAFHIGQLSIWRKAIGSPPMKRSYE